MTVAETQRLDKWLWFARVVKTRTLAAHLVEAGRVRLNRQRINKASRIVRAGDVVTVTVARRVRVLKVVGAGARRGPASEAEALYEDLTPLPSPPTPTKNRSGSAVAIGTIHSERAQGSGRPTKRERRELDRLRGRP